MSGKVRLDSYSRLDILINYIRNPPLRKSRARGRGKAEFHRMEMQTVSLSLSASTAYLLLHTLTLPYLIAIARSGRLGPSATYLTS